MWFYCSSQQVGKSISFKSELALWFALTDWMRQSGTIWLPSLGLKESLRLNFSYLGTLLEARDIVQASILDNEESVEWEAIQQQVPPTMHTSETILKLVTPAQQAID